MLPFRKCHNYKDGQLQHDLNAYGSEFKRLVIANNLNLMVNFLPSEPKNVQKTFGYWIEHADKNSSTIIVKNIVSNKMMKSP
jgi:hypothetical protein